MKWIHVFQFEIFLTDGIELPCKSQCQWSNFGDNPNWHTLPYSQSMVSLENKLELHGSCDELKRANRPTSSGLLLMPWHQICGKPSATTILKRILMEHETCCYIWPTFCKCVYIINNVLHDTIHHTVKYTILTYIYIDIEPCAWMHAKTDIK